MTYLGQMMKFTIEIPIPSFFTFLVDIPQKMQTFDVKRKKTQCGWSRSVMQFMNYEAFFNKSVLG